MSRRLRAGGLLLLALLVVLALSGTDGYRDRDPGVAAPAEARVGEVELRGSALRRAADCGPRRPVHAFQNRLHPRRETAGTRSEPAAGCR